MIKYVCVFSLLFCVLAVTVHGDVLDAKYHSKQIDVDTYLKQKAQQRKQRVQGKGATANSSKCELTLLANIAARNWAALSAETRAEYRFVMARPTEAGYSVNGNDVSFSTSGGTHQTYTTGSSNFIIHYTSGGASDPDGGGSPPTYVTTALAHFDAIAAEYVSQGYPSVPNDGSGSDAGDAGNPDTKYDVFIVDLSASNALGFCVTANGTLTGNSSSSFIVLDNDLDLTVTGSGLEETITHEYFHAIQFGMSVYPDSWIFEATATWMEGAQHESGNTFPMNQASTLFSQMEESMDSLNGGYPANIFFQHIEESENESAIRDIWTDLDTNTSSTSTDPYPSINTVLTARGSTLSETYTTFSRWNLDTSQYTRFSSTIPSLTYTINLTPTDDGTETYDIDSMGSRYYRFTPNSSADTLFITIASDSTVDAAATLMTEAGGAFSTSNIILDASNAGTTQVANFSNANFTAAYVIINNRSTSTDNATFTVAYSRSSQPEATVASSASNSGSSSSSASSGGGGSGGGGGGGCLVGALR